MKKLGSNWVLYTGDVNQNGTIDLSDIVLINNDASLFTTGYKKTDVNGDNFSDLTDLIQTNNNSGGFVQKVTPNSGPEILMKYGVSQDLIIRNEKAVFTDEILSEITPDNEIYNMFRNEYNINNSLPDIIIRDKNNAVLKKKVNR